VQARQSGGLAQADFEEGATDLALIADLLSVPMDGRYRHWRQPAAKREMTLTALLDQLDG